jgi:hypothetical protein
LSRGLRLGGILRSGSILSRRRSSVARNRRGAGGCAIALVVILTRGRGLVRRGSAVSGTTIATSRRPVGSIASRSTIAGTTVPSSIPTSESWTSIAAGKATGATTATLVTAEASTAPSSSGLGDSLLAFNTLFVDGVFLGDHMLHRVFVVENDKSEASRTTRRSVEHDGSILNFSKLFEVFAEVWNWSRWQKSSNENLAGSGGGRTEVSGAHHLGPGNRDLDINLAPIDLKSALSGILHNSVNRRRLAKCDESKATRDLSLAITHDEGILDFSVAGEESGELHIREVVGESSNKDFLLTTVSHFFLELLKFCG